MFLLKRHANRRGRAGLPDGDRYTRIAMYAAFAASHSLAPRIHRCCRRSTRSVHRVLSLEFLCTDGRLVFVVLPSACESRQRRCAAAELDPINVSPSDESLRIPNPVGPPSCAPEANRSIEPSLSETMTSVLSVAVRTLCSRPPFGGPAVRPPRLARSRDPRD